MRKETKLLYTLALAVVYLLYMGSRSLPHQKPVFEKEGGFYYVLRVVDGDTIKLSDGRSVRLIGVDTPELHYSNKLVRDAKRSRRDIKEIQALGKKAADFTAGLLEGKRVRLEYDVVRKDKYGRTLAYVYKEDGTFVNAKILEEGYGQIMTIPPNVKYAGSFLNLQGKARDGKKGLWRDDQL